MSSRRLIPRRDLAQPRSGCGITASARRCGVDMKTDLGDMHYVIGKEATALRARNRRSVLLVCVGRLRNVIGADLGL